MCLCKLNPCRHNKIKFLMTVFVPDALNTDDDMNLY